MMILNVCPLLWLTKFSTFSKNTTFGIVRSMISAMSKNMVPFVTSRNPCLRPILLNAWHGKPASKTSYLVWATKSLNASSVTSCLGSSPNRCWYVLHAYSSFSAERTFSKSPANSNPLLIPPIPLHKSIVFMIPSFIFCFLFFQML